MRLTISLLYILCISNLSYAQSSSRWYILSLGDRPVGFYREISTTSNNGISTDIHIKLKISRLGSENIMESRQSFLEAQKGALIQIKSELLFSKQLNQVTADIKDKVIKMTHSTGGKETVSEIPNQLTLLGNEGVRLQSIANLIKPGDSITYYTFFPEYSMVVQGKRQYLSDERLEIRGDIVQAKKVKDTFKGLPIIRVSWLDKDGRFLKSTEPNPFGEMTLVLSDEKSALTISNAKTELSADQYSSTMAKSNVRLAQSRRIESMTVKVKHRKPELGYPKFDGSYQTVVEQGNDYAVIKIIRPKIGERKEPLTAAMKQQFIESSSFFNKDDTLVLTKAKEIIKGETDPWKKAIAIRDWVNKNMRFDPGIAMAPSSEVMRNLAGTCVSFATITTTLCRAAGIPSRYLAGYVYVDGAWGGHAWVEVYIDETWVPIDAAMPSPSGVADASRFFFSRTSGVNGISECFIGGSQLYSNVDIEILDYTLDGRISNVKEPLYSLQNGIYNNKGLGLTAKCPDGFTFSELDKFYPDNTLFLLNHENGKTTVQLKQYYLSPRTDLETIVKNRFKELQLNSEPKTTTFNGLRAIRGSGTENAILIIENGVDVFVLISEGLDAGKNLDLVVKKMTIKPNTK